MLAFIGTLASPPPVVVRQNHEGFEVDNGSIQLRLDPRQGVYSVAWGAKSSISAIVPEARLKSGERLTPHDYREHEIGPKDVKRIKDKFGTGVELVVHYRGENRPEMRQTFWVYSGRPEVFTRLDLLSSSGVSSNYICPVATETPIKAPHQGPLQCLFVPYDNDAYIHYRSDGWSGGKESKNGSYEVGALYDDVTREGIVIGSIDHERWKTGVRFDKIPDGEAGALHVFAGAADSNTRDVQPHGVVSGAEIGSPRIVIGRYSDWRDGMERFAEINASVQPALPWPDAVPFGWNSWVGHKEKVTQADALAACDFIHDELPKFRSGGTAYINFDSFWDNLSRYQLVRFVEKVHAAGFKAGIYWSPYAGWGKLEDKIAHTKYTVADLAVKDENGKPLPRVDGAEPLDPTHPGSLERVQLQLDDFVKLGFDFVKLDFLTHGSVEGVHADPKVQTGTEAYRIGMKQIDDLLSPKRIGRPFFISFSIAPLFPSGYAHSRRISCDIFVNIGATEYLLNSSNYAWWEAGRLYPFNDPDATCVYRTPGDPVVSEAEARSRFSATVISGGMLLEADDLTKPENRARVKEIYSHQELVDLSRRAVPFRPVFGNTGEKSGEVFVDVDKPGHAAYVAIFNFDKTQSATKVVPLNRIGFGKGKTWKVHDLWTGKDRTTGDSLQVDLPPMDCTVVKLSD